MHRRAEDTDEAKGRPCGIRIMRDECTYSGKPYNAVITRTFSV